MTAAALLQVFNAYADPVSDVGGAAAYKLCSAEGIIPPGIAEVKPFYYTRQIGN
jgi:hypothetical protein